MMLYVDEIRRSATQVLGDDVSAAAYAALQRFVNYRLYRRTIRELSQLGAQDLADLGLHRSEIRRVAWESVYGRRS